MPSSASARPGFPPTAWCACSRRDGLPGVRFERSDFTPEAPGDGKYGEPYHPGRADRASRIATATTPAAPAPRCSGRSRAGRAGLARRARHRAFDDRFGRAGDARGAPARRGSGCVVARDDAAVAAWRREVAPYPLYPISVGMAALAYAAARMCLATRGEQSCAVFPITTEESLP